MRSNLPAHLNPEHPVLKQEYAVFTPPLGAMGVEEGKCVTAAFASFPSNDP